MCIFDVGVLTSNRILTDLVFPKINVTKLEMVITFDREVRWRRVKNESCSK